MKTITISLLVATVIGAGFATGATAAPSDWDKVRTQTVPYSDLDLSRPEGAQVLIKRINRAASAVCGDPAASNLQNISRKYRRCVRDATQRAVDDVDSPTVTALHSGASPMEVAGK